MRIVSKIVSVISFIIVGMFMTIVLAIGLMTPEKTKNGNYTDVWKYWTNDTYLCQNFCDCDCSNVK